MWTELFVVQVSSWSRLKSMATCLGVVQCPVLYRAREKKSKNNTLYFEKSPAQEHEPIGKRVNLSCCLIFAIKGFVIWKSSAMERGWCPHTKGEGLVGHSRTTKFIQVVIIKPNNYIVWQGPLVGQTKQLHCTTTPNQTITLYDNTKSNNYIVWQHQTKQLHCLTTPNQTITLCNNM